MRSDLSTLGAATNTGFERLGGEFSRLNREVGEIKVALDYAGLSSRPARPNRPEAGSD